MSLLTKNLSFAGRVGQNIVDDEYKRHILAVLSEKYGAQVLKKHYVAYDEEHIKRVPVLSCLRSNGNPYYMFLTQYNDKNICIFVDKKIQTSYSLPRMVCTFFQIQSSLFKGTVIDGEMVKDSDDNWVFLINDVLALGGSSVTSANFCDRLAMIHDALRTKFRSSSADVCKFQVKKYVTVDNLRDLVEQHFPYTHRGIIFKPLYSKFQDMQFNFDDSIIKPVTKVVKSEFVSDLRLMQKKISVCRGQTVDNYTSAEGEVFVRTLKNALSMRALFLNQPVNKVVDVECVWNGNFNMWELVPDG